jgi:hypothetical protein
VSGFACPHCGYDGSRPARHGPEPFTYFEEVPRWQKVHLRGGRLVVETWCTYGDEGTSLFLRCNDCENLIGEDALPELVFEQTAPDTLGADLVGCAVCHAVVPGLTAHRHDGGYIGDECCWDERLRATE